MRSDPETQKHVALELASIVASMSAALSDQELAELVDRRLPDVAVRVACMQLLRRISERGVIRLEAERDGWRAIANHLIKIAMGDGAEGFDIPPIELLDLNRGSGTGHYVVALEQFWADVTRKHEERRRQHAERYLRVDEEVEAGDLVDGNGRVARGSPAAMFGAGSALAEIADRITVTSQLAPARRSPSEKRQRSKRRRQLRGRW